MKIRKVLIKSKILPIAMIGLMLVVMLLPFGSAFAYTGGLLNGLTLYQGVSIDDTTLTRTAYTDGNEATSSAIGIANSSTDTIWYKFNTPYNLTDYQLKSNGSTYIYFYDSNKNQIASLSGVTTGNKTPLSSLTIEQKSNVSYVALVNNSTSTRSISEFDVFGSAVTVNYSGGLLDGKNLISAAGSATDAGEVGNPSLTGATDNNESTSISVSGAYHYIKYIFGTPSDLGSYRVNSANSLRLHGYDSSNVKILDIPVVADGSKQTFTSVSGVKTVSLYKSDSIAWDLKEFNVYLGVVVPVVKTDVTGVDVTGITKTGSSVSWLAPTGYSGVTLSGFKIYVDGVLKHTASPSSSSYSLTGLTADTSYTVKVVASYSDGTETTGVTKVFNTLVPEDETAPANVTNLVATPTFDSISLSWTNPPDQDFAKVKVYEDGIYKKSVTAAEGSSAFFGNLEPDTDYSFKVTSIDNIGNESSGSVIEVTTLPLPEIKKIKNLDATSKFDRVKLSWELPESEYFHHVNIYRKVVEEESFFESLFSLGEIKVSAADTEEEYRPMFETNGTYWTDLTVEPETKYEYKLTSENVDGRESTEGVVVQVSTPEEPKPVLKDAEFQAATNGDYVIKWSEPTTGNVKIKVGGNDYKTVPANLKTYTIPKSDLAYTTIGDPDVTIQPVLKEGQKGMLFLVLK
jgi:hypothetical protein